jgi:hypothetical protein
MYDYDRFQDALFARAELSNPDNPYPYMTGYLLSMVKHQGNIESSTKDLEKTIREQTSSVDEQTLIDLMWQHEPLDKTV